MADEFDATITSDLDKTVAAFPKALGRALRYITLDLHGNLVKEAPKDHGKLAGSWTPQQMGELYWAINSKTKYRFMIETGTKAHEIRPKTKKSLAFKVQGEWVFCTLVKHPGTKANPYITRSIDKTEKRVGEFVDKAIKEVLGGTV